MDEVFVRSQGNPLFAIEIGYMFKESGFSDLSEKETGVRDSMRMMGLSEIAYWSSWLLYYLIINILVTSLCTVVLYAYLF